MVACLDGGLLRWWLAKMVACLDGGLPRLWLA